MNLPILATSEDCTQLSTRLDLSLPVVALWATGLPRQTVDVLLHFRNLLRQRGKQVVLLVTRSGVDFLLTLCPPEERTFIYQCDNQSLLGYCPFFSILFSHDFCVARPERFVGRVALFQHNFSMLSPNLGNYWADYAVSREAKALPFDFSSYPNVIKRRHNTFFTIIPSGYPKLDILLRLRESYGEGPHFRAAYFPVPEFWLHSKGIFTNRVVEQESALVELFLDAYPDFEFVVHPYRMDHESKRFCALRERFQGRSGFRYETGTDNTRDLVTSDVLFTDYSSIDRNFAYTTLRPVIRLQPTTSLPTFRTSFLGYDASLAHQALAAVQDAFTRLSDWEESIKKERAKEVCHPGTSLDYLCDHLDALLEDRPQPDWIVSDKGNTPFDHVADYLRLFADPPHALAYQPCPSDWAILRHGQNAKIGLAALRACLRVWNDYVEVSRLTLLQEQIETAFSYVPSSWLLGLLRHAEQKNPGNGVHTLWLAVALARFAPDSGSELSHLLDRLEQMPLDPVATAVACKLLHGRGRSAAALELLEQAIPGHQAPLHVYVMHACLLMAAGNLDGAEKRLDGVRHFFFSASGFSPELAFCTALLIAVRAGHPLPELHFHAVPGALSLYGMWFSFRDPGEAFAVLSPYLSDLRRYAENAENGSFWHECSIVYDVSGKLDEAVEAARKAVQYLPDTLYILTHFMDILAKAGFYGEAARIAEKAIGRWPGNADFIDTLSLLHECAGDIPAAFDAARRALECGPERSKRLERLKRLRALLTHKSSL